MVKLEIDLTKTIGPVKAMNAVNNGPIRPGRDQTRGNLDLYKAARIPFGRTHDANHCAAYGAPHVVDIPVIFPDFSADVDDPASYDFVLTDVHLQAMIDAGTEPYYRLGSKIEHWVKKYDTLPPPDPVKWARICEHVIRHCNEGWADGFHWNIRYWEIWNEPDLDSDDSPNKRCWGGTEAQFHELFRIAATHLKKCFPSIKVGGPALAGNTGWADRFLADMAGDATTPRVPLDFFSWHLYATDPAAFGPRVREIRALMDKHGYTEAESILNEYNYVRGWTDDWVYSIEQMIGIKGAVFTASAMCVCQSAPLDMLMYYDARPCVMNGMFDFYTFRARKCYYPFIAFAELVDLGTQVAMTDGVPNVFTLAASDGKGAFGTMVCVFAEDDSDREPREIELSVKGGDFVGAKCRILDEDRDLEEVPLELEGDRARLSLAPNSLAFITR